MSGPRRALASLALLAASLGVSALALEVAVRATFGPQVKFPRHVVGAPWGLRINEPDATYRHRSAEVDVGFHINGQGMRADRDYAYAKPPGVRRIVSLGDSFTVGYEVELEQTFSAVLERELRAAGLDAEVLNAGVSGYSNAEACLYLERELLKYSPDLVLVSFFGNDLVDNLRSDLFRLEDGELVESAAGYVPAGGLGDFLNTNPVFNLLSERSDAFALLKEQLTLLMKSRIVERNVENLERVEAPDGDEGPPYEARLTAAIFERIYATTRERGIPLVVQSIPSPRDDPERLVELFPVELFDFDRAGLAFVPAKRVLDPWLGREQLYHTRSHWHWTPHAHREAGRALAEVILRRGLLGPPAERSPS